jgi:membrane-bound lytic murein transglycosylase D
MKKIYFIFLIFIIFGCSTSKKENVVKEEKKEEVVSISAQVEEPVQNEEFIEVEVLEPIIEIDEEIEVLPVIPETETLPPHPAVEEAINFYSVQYFEKYKDALERFSYYKKEMEKIFQEEDVPTDLIYVSLTESLFNPRARSRKGAYGIWQFISPTAKLYGLKIDSFIDERADFIKSTKAAAKYLKESYTNFEGDLLLTIASYNCGIGNVLKAQRKCNAKQFWDIRKCLPKETRNFVPSVLASIEIGKNPSKYNFSIDEKELPKYTEVFIPYSVNLKKILKDENNIFETIKQINPELRSNYTPPYGFNLKLTEDIFEVFTSKLPYHIAKEGETLKDLEIKYKVKEELIAKVNRLNKNETLKEGQRIFIPEDTFEGYHIVQRGENPYSISKKYGVSLEKFLEVNGLTKKTIIYPGQKLKVPGGFITETKVYKVKKGDTLAKIARKFSTTIEKIMELNGLTSQDIKPGIVLQIE